MQYTMHSTPEMYALNSFCFRPWISLIWEISVRNRRQNSYLFGPRLFLNHTKWILRSIYVLTDKRSGPWGPIICCRSTDYGPWGPIIGCRSTDYGPCGPIIGFRLIDYGPWGLYIRNSCRNIWFVRSICGFFVRKYDLWGPCKDFCGRKMIEDFEINNFDEK